MSYHSAVKPLTLRNTGTEDLVILKFFGPEVNQDAPRIGQQVLAGG